MMCYRELINRWRLMLGLFSDDTLTSTVEDGEGGAFIYQEIDDLLDFLYSRK